MSEPIVIRVAICRTNSGLFYTDSPDLPGLVITAATEEELMELTPKGIAGILRAMFAQELNVFRARQPIEIDNDEPDLWVAVPPYIAAQALHL